MIEGWAQRAIQKQEAKRLSYDSHRVYQHTKAWSLLALTTLIALLMFALGCAARIVDVGRTYYVVWPNAQPDIVEIHRTYKDGWVQCRSVTDNVVWTCNLNTALYFVRVTQRDPAPRPQSQPNEGQRTD